MSERWEAYQAGNVVRLRRVGSKKQAAKPVKTPEPVDYSSLKKDELVTEAERRGVDTSGTKAEIVERLND